MGTLAISIGKIAIKTGIAMKAIKLSFKNPALAIISGIALVALGTAVNASVKSAMAGSGGGGTFSGNTGGGTYDTRTNFGTSSGVTAQAQPITVNVIGESRLRGNDIVTIFNETNKRSGYS